MRNYITSIQLSAGSNIVTVLLCHRNVNECSRPAVSGEAVAAGNVVPQDSRFQSQNEAAVTRDDSDVTTCRRYRFPLLHSASFDQ